MKKYQLSLLQKNAFINYISGFSDFSDTLILELENKKIISKCGNESRDAMRIHQTDLEDFFEPTEVDKLIITKIVWPIANAKRFLQVLKAFDSEVIQIEIKIEEISHMGCNFVDKFRLSDSNLKYDLEALDYRIVTLMDDSTYLSVIDTSEDSKFDFNISKSLLSKINQLSKLEEAEEPIGFRLKSSRITAFGKHFEQILENSTSKDSQEIKIKNKYMPLLDVEDLNVVACVESNKLVFKSIDGNKHIVIGGIDS
jgi:hypothetical protein